jgi:L-seryl-tRNA(Ser) seleniumtransferase
MTTPHSDPPANPFRELPSVERVLGDERVARLSEEHGHESVAALAREVIEEYRAAIAGQGRPPMLPVAQAVVERARVLEPSLKHVVNATGVIIHTNLGRAPLAASAMDAMRRVSAGYSNLEFDLEAGERGSRFSHLERLLRLVTGAEAGIAVNNNAGALLLALSALCRDREVIISRGQLVEIGGGFRIPDVMRQSGARLVEVGTTNRTYARDYAEAITDETAAILRVHSSNFRVVGFTAEAGLVELATLARERGLLLIDDLGSGALLDTRPYGLAAEPMVQDSVRGGADVVLASGDKLLGGPQAGLAVGTADGIAKMRSHPLARALRMDKATIAGLTATLEHYARGDAVSAIPVWRMIATDTESIGRRARRWSRAGGEFSVADDSTSTIGGGTLPGEELPTVVCAVTPPDGDATGFAARMREAAPPIIARIEDGRVLLDPRTVDVNEDWHVEATLEQLCRRGALAGPGPGGVSPGR